MQNAADSTGTAPPSWELYEILVWLATTFPDFHSPVSVG
jgi:hypothetical protein